MGAAYTTAELVGLHKRSLLDAAQFFDAPADADFIRHLRIAGRALATDNKRPRTVAASLQLVAGQPQYPAPANLVQVKASPWGVAQTQSAPWCAPRTPLPILRVLRDETGAALVCLQPAPTVEQLAAFGATFPFYYTAAHDLADAPDEASSVTDDELDLLLLRAKVEALRELAIRNHSKPVTMHGGAGEGIARNQTAASLYEQFLREYQAAV